MDTANAIRVLLLDLGSELRGGQRQVLYLARALENLRQNGADLEVVVACPKDSPLAEAVRDASVPLVALPGRGIANPALLFCLRRAVRRQRINIFHTHDARAASVGAWFKRWNPALRLIHARRVSYPMRQGSRGKKYLAADAVVAVSGEIARGLIAGGLDASKVHTIHSGIDPDRYAPKRPRHDGRFVFGAIGALTAQKGFEVLIQAMSVLSGIEDLPPWEVRIIGEGPLFEDLLRSAADQGVVDRLALFGRQDSRQFLPQFDALLVPSVDGEGSSAVIKEGWAVGVPVVCSGLPSNEELVRDKENGLVVPVGNPLALSAAMLRLANEPALAARLVAGGRESLQRFTHLQMALSTVAVYAGLLGVPEPEITLPSGYAGAEPLPGGADMVPDAAEARPAPEPCGQLSEPLPSHPETAESSVEASAPATVQ